jgi:hypothetical protein
VSPTEEDSDMLMSSVFILVTIKNKPPDRESEHTFILGSMDCRVVKSKVVFEDLALANFHTNINPTPHGSFREC